MREYYFEKLEVWKLSKELVKDIYKVTDRFPGSEQIGIVSQMRRSAVSVPTNLAEGSSRSTKKDQANFTTIAYSSLMELLNLIIISNELTFIQDEVYSELRSKIEEISNKLNALKRSQLSKA